MRAKLPQGKGGWPAFWTLGEDIGKGGWPVCGEIDVMEFVSHDPNLISARRTTGSVVIPHPAFRPRLSSVRVATCG